MRHKGKLALLLILGGLAGLVIWRLSGDEGASAGRGQRGAAPVEVAEVVRGPIEDRRVFSGTLEARERSVIAADAAGRVGRLLVDLGDGVRQGQVIAELDDADEVQGVRQASADLAVARAQVDSAKSGLELATRELERMRGLVGRGLVAEAELDSARASHLQRKTAVEVAQAQLARAGASVQRARIQSGYTQVSARWTGDDQERVVAERHVNEGDRVNVNQPLLTVVGLAPITAVVHVTERDYGSLEPGQPATLTTDAYPGQRFEGAVARIAPVFRESSRQARVELQLANADGALKPGMFVRAEVVLGRDEDATIVPVNALTTRAGETGVFVIVPGAGETGPTVRWRAVQVGIREGERVAVTGTEIQGQVVTLGQQLVDDGAPVTVPRRAPDARRADDGADPASADDAAKESAPQGPRRGS